MSDEKEDKKKATRRVSSEEVNKKARNKKTKNSNAETQVVGKVNAKNGKNKKENGKKKKKFKERHPRIATIIKIIIILIVLLIIIFAGILAGALWGGYNFFDLLGNDYKIDMDDLVIPYENSTAYDINGNPIGTLSAGTKRKSVSLDEMSPYLPKAYLAIEDERFYKHSGVDFKRTAAATLNYIFHKGKSSFGGSTITQQVVKNITGDKEDTAMRKVKEMAKALQVEHYLSKHQILELYLNLIFVGGKDVNGVALGAIYYFNKDVKDLTLAECAYMAAINNTPNSYNPFSEDAEKNQERIKKGQDRAKKVLDKMKELGYINSEEYDTGIKDLDAGLAFSNGDTNTTTMISYQTSAALEQIVNQMVEEKGMSKDLAEIKLYSGGYHIYTTQDTNLQAIVEGELQESRVFTSRGEGEASRNGQKSMAAMTIVDPKTGNVVATSAVKTEGDQRTTQTFLGYFNQATEIKKQTGSSIKPLAVLSPGLELGKLNAASTFYDGYTVFPGDYKPKNEGAYTNTNMSLRTAIAKSQNIPHVKAMSILGVDNSVEFLNKLGLNIVGDEGLQLALGGLSRGVSPMQMASAYAMIANDGVYIEPTFYTKVLDKDGNTYIEPKTIEERSTRVMNASNAYIVKNLMKNVVATGTATYCAIPGIDVCAKTGTTNDNNDRWLCGYTNYYAAACWVGFEKSAQVHAEGLQNPAGTIWSHVMKKVHKDLPNSEFAVPNNIVSAQICADTGLSASEKCTNVYTEQFVKGTVPEKCDRHTPLKICNETGLLASEFCLNYRMQSYRVTSPFEDLGKWKTTYAGSNFNIPSEVCPHTADSYNYPD